MQHFSSNTLGWTLIASGVFWILQLIFVTLLYTVNPLFGSWSDFSNAVTVLLMLPFVWALYNLTRDQNQVVSMIAALFGIAGIISAAVPSILIIIDRMTFQQTLPPIIAGFGAIGLWLLLHFLLARAGGELPGRVTLWGIVIGLGLFSFSGLLTVDMHAIFTGGGMGGFWSNPLVYPAITVGALGYFAYPVWVIWLGRMIANGSLVAP
jgi:hypothetical protein